MSKAFQVTTIKTNGKDHDFVIRKSAIIAAKPSQVGGTELFLLGGGSFLVLNHPSEFSWMLEEKVDVTTTEDFDLQHVVNTTGPVVATKKDVEAIVKKPTPPRGINRNMTKPATAPTKAPPVATPPAIVPHVNVLPTLPVKQPGTTSSALG